MEAFFQLNGCSNTGGWPLGAQVRRTFGVRLSALSSKKTRQALRRWARLTRKSTVSGRRQHPAERQRSRVASVRCGSGGGPGWDRLCGRGGRSGGEGDRLARELLELADQVAFLAVPAAAGLIEVGTPIAVTSFGVGQQVPHDRQDRVADRGQGRVVCRGV